METLLTQIVQVSWCRTPTSLDFDSIRHDACSVPVLAEAGCTDATAGRTRSCIDLEAFSHGMRSDFLYTPLKKH